MKKIYTLILVLSTLLLTSCEGFLDRYPTNQADSKTSIQTTDDAEVMINGVLRYMSSSSYYGRAFLIYGDYKGGDLIPFMMGRGYDSYYTFNHSPSSGSGGDFWNRIYFCIMQVNNLIENIERLEEEGAIGFDSYKGIAYTLRAQLYFDLVRLYGKPYNYEPSSLGIPITLKVLDAYDRMGRNTVKETYDQIVADLKAGQGLMPTNLNKNDIKFYYYNRALQAKVYLYMDNFSDALTAAKDVIDNGGYTLYTNANWYDSWSNEFDTESIFELSILTNEADLGTGSIGYYYLPKNYAGINVAGILSASDYYLNRLGSDADDVRWSVMVADEKDDPSATPPVVRHGGCVKYVGGKTVGGDKGSKTAVNIKVMRLSEVYLIAAEAALMQSSSDPATAATYLNNIRKRSPNLAPATAVTITRRMILDERSKEFYAEGHKFFEEIRADQTIEFNDEMCEGGFSSALRNKTIDRTFYKTILPIDADEINANPILKDQQNPVY